MARGRARKPVPETNKEQPDNSPQNNIVLTPTIVNENIKN